MKKIFPFFLSVIFVTTHKPIDHKISRIYLIEKQFPFLSSFSTFHIFSLSPPLSLFLSHSLSFSHFNSLSLPLLTLSIFLNLYIIFSLLLSLITGSLFSVLRLNRCVCVCENIYSWEGNQKASVVYFLRKRQAHRCCCFTFIFICQKINTDIDYIIHCIKSYEMD